MAMSLEIYRCKGQARLEDKSSATKSVGKTFVIRPGRPRERSLSNGALVNRLPAVDLMRGAETTAMRTSRYSYG